MDKRKIVSSFCIFIVTVAFVCLLSLNFYFLVANEEIIKIFLSEKLKESINEKQFEYAKEVCKAFPEIFKITTPYGNITCEDIGNKSYEETVNEISEKFTRNFYERRLNCTVIECLENNRWDVLLSSEAKTFFMKIYLYFVFILGFFSVLSVAAARDRIKALKNLCLALLLTIFGVMFLNFFIPSLLSYLPHDVYEYMMSKLVIFQRNVVYLSILFLIALVACYLAENIKARSGLLQP